ncbi:MAG: phage terminase large subunit, partial [Bradyrhizobium sp.]|nr:phage terminase large subunit [Bradyrhizobium sp.]
VERTLLATASRDGTAVKIDLPQDPGQAGKSQVQHFTRLLGGYTVRSSPETGDKVLRAEPLAAQVNVGNVSLVRAAWNQALIDEMRSFPNGSHDDQVDALSRAYSAVALAPLKARAINVPFLGR